jgi:hypothetical protein
MLVINGVFFAETEKEFVNSLFEKQRSCSGYARRNRRSIVLMNHRREQIGAINSSGLLCRAGKAGKKCFHEIGVPSLLKGISVEGLHMIGQNFKKGEDERGLLYR